MDEQRSELDSALDRWNEGLREYMLSGPKPPINPKLRTAMHEYTEIAGNYGMGSKEEKEARERFSKEIPDFDAAARGLSMAALSIKRDLFRAWEREHGKSNDLPG